MEVYFIMAKYSYEEKLETVLRVVNGDMRVMRFVDIRNIIMLFAINKKLHPKMEFLVIINTIHHGNVPTTKNMKTQK